MASGTRGIPRFLPTLTEVVQPGVPLQPADSAQLRPPEMAPASGAPHTTAPADDVDTLQRTLALEARLREQLEQRVRHIVEGALAAQVNRVTSQVMGELEPAIRQLARENGLHGIPPSDAG